MTGSPPIGAVFFCALLLWLALWTLSLKRRATARPELPDLVASQAELLASTVSLAERQQAMGEPMDQIRAAADGFARELSTTLDELAAEIRAGIAAMPAPRRRGAIDALRDEGLPVRALFLAGAAGRAGRALAAAGPGDVSARLEAFRSAVSELIDLAVLVRH